jgi:hypothetical protein
MRRTEAAHTTEAREPGAKPSSLEYNAPSKPNDLLQSTKRALALEFR